jgi:hypothetical protein
MGIDRLYPIGGREWDLSSKEDQKICEGLIEFLNPLVLHTAPACSKLCSLGLKEGQEGFNKEEYERAEGVVIWCVRLHKRRAKPGPDRKEGSLESPKTSRAWKISELIDFFGTVEKPAKGAYFAKPDGCANGMLEPGTIDVYWRKSMVLAANYQEILEVSDTCPGNHAHVAIRGSVKVPGGGWDSRARLSGVYPLRLCLVWGRAIAKACLRLSSPAAERWANQQLDLAQRHALHRERQGKTRAPPLPYFPKESQ